MRAVLLLCAAALGCASRVPPIDASVHSQVTRLQDSDDGELRRVGSISRADLASGAATTADAVMLDVGPVTASSPAAGRICFRAHGRGFGGRVRGFAVRTHESGDQFAEGAPWPEPTLVPTGAAEVCAPTPELTDATKFLSLALLRESASGHRIAVWNVRP